MVSLLANNQMNKNGGRQDARLEPKYIQPCGVAYLLIAGTSTNALSILSHTL
jgi:hypothetical protein